MANELFRSEGIRDDSRECHRTGHCWNDVCGHLHLRLVHLFGLFYLCWLFHLSRGGYLFRRFHLRWWFHLRRRFYVPKRFHLRWCRDLWRFYLRIFHLRRLLHLRWFRNVCRGLCGLFHQAGGGLILRQCGTGGYVESLAVHCQRWDCVLCGYRNRLPGRFQRGLDGVDRPGIVTACGGCVHPCSSSKLRRNGYRQFRRGGRRQHHSLFGLRLRFEDHVPC